MKKGLLLLGLAVALLTSCKKDYTCKCSVLFFSVPTVIEDVTKSEAKDKCADLEKTYNKEENSIPVSCKID
jgi:hypothetical protein